MAYKPKAVKYKVITGYLLLFAVASATVWFVYSEILKSATANPLAGDNARIIRISNTIASLYSSEALARSAILTKDPAELKKYLKLTDSISGVIDAIKSGTEEAEQRKLDSIQLLIARKKLSVKELVKFKQEHSEQEIFGGAIKDIGKARDSVWQQTKPVEMTKNTPWQETVRTLLTAQQLDSLSRLPVSNDSLALAFRKVLNGNYMKSRQISYQLYKREQKLLDENRIISDQLRTILSDVEKDFVQKSYSAINKRSTSLNKTINTLTWVGAGTLLLLIILASIIIRDLSINQNYRQRLEVLNKENEQLLHTRSMLMATVTHDLQTPLGSIFGFHDLLKESGVSDNQKQYLANIRQSADYIMKLVNDLLDFSRLENNRITIEQIPFNIKNAIENTCSALEPLASKKNIELYSDVDDSLDRYFLSDPYRLKQVLTNLISNAIKFTDDGSVEVTAKIDGFDISISVIDTGIGIAADKHHTVFKEFTQAHDGIEKKFGGTGLGLTISKRIIEMLGGTITLESQEGQGSIFTITLPCIASKKPETPLIPVHIDVDINGKKVLIVDDDSTQLALMKELLQNAGAIVITEIHATNAVTILKNEDFDVVLTDVQMPVMNGFELVAQIRELPSKIKAAIPVIALSGRRDLENSYYTDKGFTAHLTKPVNITALKELIADNDITTTVRQSHVAEIENNEKLFNLSSLSQFTQNDPESLRIIIQTFTDSAEDNCNELIDAAKAADEERLGRIAHKMIPMLRQMEVLSIAEMLMPLEDKTLNDDIDIIEYCTIICHKMDRLCELLQKEIA